MKGCVNMSEVKGHKVFNPDWTCRGVQYKVGETIEMYNISKVKSWIKRSAKKDFMYYPEAELITDGIAIIYAQPSMKPAILEAFGHLDGGIIRSGVFTARTYTS